jgi:hypothetical protein
MAFLFLDECFYAPLDMAALTGVLVPLDQYVAVRDAMCKVVADVLAAPPNTVPAPIELHASNLLSTLSERTTEKLDQDRLDVLSKVVGIVNQHALRVIRVAYLNRKEIASRMTIDPKLYGLTFYGIESALQETMRDTIVLPVMDGVPGCAPNATRPPAIDPRLIRAFAQNVRLIHHYRQYEVAARSISIDNVVNLAEPVFSDSTHSTLLQLVDIVSHLMLQLERDELEPKVSASPYHPAVLERAKNLRADLLCAWKGRMSFC